MAARNNDASTQDVSSPSQPTTAENGAVATTGNDAKENDEGADGQNDGVFELAVKLPHAPYKTEIHVSPQEQVQDIRQSIIDLPFTMQYTCFHLEHKGKRINDFVELSEVPDIGPGSELTLVEDPYTEKDARLHFVRVRELIGAAGDRTDTTHGVLAAASLHDEVMTRNIAGYIAENTDATAQKAKLDLGPNYDFEGQAKVDTLLPQQEQDLPKTVKSISVSPWSPPPYHLRMRGHLLYLQITTNEGEQHQITAHIGGFYVNRSTKDKFDPSPRTSPKDISAHSLLSLLEKLSPSFEESFRSLLEENGKKDPLAIFALQNAIPASPWAVPPPSSSFLTHQSDPTRSQESYLYSGAENADSLRDWNEEFQSTRELPKEQMQERVFRERLTSKLFADFSEAAARGAVLVARGDVLALNPTESRDAQIFVYNNIFFSFGADGMGTFAADGGDEAARVATGKDVVGVKAVNQLDINGLFTPGTVIVDYLGQRIVAQSVVPGIFKQREPGEHQVDYGGVEGKDVVADNEAFVPYFEQLSQQMHVKKHPVWDKEEKRHDLEGSIETKGLLGTDGRHYVLDLYRITPLDVNFLEKYWTESKENQTKEADKNYPHRMAVLRPELVASYARMKLGEFVHAELEKRGKKPDGTAASTEKEGVEAQEGNEKALATNGTSESAEDKKDDNEVSHIDASNFKFALNPDVFCGQVPLTQEEKDELEKDEVEVRAVCDYLTSKVIPGLIQELQDGDVSFPMDGHSLSQLLHKRGINMRYLGEIARLADSDNQRLQALGLLARQEMVTRAFKHFANSKMKYLPLPAAASATAHLLNCLVGTQLTKKPRAETEESVKSLYSDVDFSYEQVTPEALRTELIKQIQIRYRYEYDGDLVADGRQLQITREVALKLGLQLEARQYHFSNKPQTNGINGVNGHAEPHVNGVAKKSSKKKKKGSDNGSPARAATPAQNVTFHPEDIVNIVPVVKEASPRSVLAEDAFEAGRISIGQGDRQRGQTLLLESLSLYEQIYGILHPEVANAYSQLSTVYYGLEEKGAAVELARKAVIVAERTLGVDSAITILNYLNLGLFEHAQGNGELAFRYLVHALELMKVVYGSNHPDSITTINNGAVMLQQLKRYPESRVWFEASLSISERVQGKDSVATATLLFQLAQALALDNEARAAVNKMRDSYNIFNTKLGAENPNTKDAATWLERLTQNAVVQARREKVLAELPVRRVGARHSHGLGSVMRTHPQVGQSRDEMIAGTRKRAGTRDFDDRKIEDLIRYIEGGDRTTPKKKKVQTKRGARTVAA